MMMKNHPVVPPGFRAFAIVVLLGLLLAPVVPASAARDLENIPLQWRPTTNPAEGGPREVPRARVQIGTFRDARATAQRARIGENREDAPKVVRPVTTRDSVPAWCAAHLRDAGRLFGLRVVDTNPDVVVSGEVLRFFVVEENTYQGEITLRLVARRPGGGVVWSGTASGTATRFGRSYKAENYYEVLSDALVDAVGRLLEREGFTRAVRGSSRG